MLSIKARTFTPLGPRSLEDLVPADNFYRSLDAKLDLSFVRAWVADCYAERGRPSIDPVVFFKLQLIQFFEGIRSERKLMESVALHLAQCWYVGYDLDESLPDHSSLTRIRQRLGLSLFDRFFQYVVELCDAAVLIWGKELIFDGTKVRANADTDSLSPRFYQQAKQHIEDLFAANAADGPAPSAGVGIPVVPEPLPADGRSADRPPGHPAGAEYRTGDPPMAEPIPLPSPGSVAGEELAQEDQAA
jgi:transposase